MKNLLACVFLLVSLESVERPLAPGADSSIRDSEDKRAVDHAADLRRSDIVRILHEAEEVEPYLASPLLLEAAKANDLHEVERLLAAGADPNYRDRREVTPLHAAIKNESLEMARLLVDSGADPSAPANYGMRPLMQAASLADTTILSWLLEQDDFSETEVSDALLFATTDETVALLLKRGADPNHIGSLEYQGNHVASQIMDGSTPLMRAASVGCLNCIDLLVAAGADPTYVGPGIETALMSARTTAAVEKIESLLPPPDPSQLAAIIEAVFKELAGPLRRGGPALSFGEGQPVPDGIESQLPREINVDRSGQARRRIEIGSVTWIRPDLVLVIYDDLGYGMGGHGGVFALKSGKDGWTVVDSKNLWVS